MVSAMPVSRTRQLLGTDSVIRPEYKWHADNASKTWDLTLDVSAVFAVSDMVEVICPLSFNKDGRYSKSLAVAL